MAKKKKVDGKQLGKDVAAAFTLFYHMCPSLPKLYALLQFIEDFKPETEAQAAEFALAKRRIDLAIAVLQNKRYEDKMKPLVLRGEEEDKAAQAEPQGKPS